MGMFYRKVTAIILQPHVKNDIESEILWRTLVGTYLFCALETQMIRYIGQWKVEKTVATVHTIT